MVAVLRRLLAPACLLLAACTGDPCPDVKCGEGHCILSEGAPSCQCNAGFHADGLSCAADSDAGCPDGVCTCPEGQVRISGACVAPSPCDLNPCIAEHQHTCVVEAGQALCVCDPGFAPGASGCTVEPVTCEPQHALSDEDAFEPDECPALARVSAVPFSQDHSLRGPEDVDWIGLVSPPGFVVHATFTSAEVPLHVDAYAPDGVTPLAADHRGVTEPSIWVLVEKLEPYFLRVGAAQPDAVGNYSVALAVVGPDDFANDPLSAKPIAPGDSFVGEVQYPGDTDLVRLSLSGMHSYRIEPLTGTSQAVVFELLGSDAQSVLRTWEWNHVGTPFLWRVAEATYLRARALNGSSVGRFLASFKDLGPDDHGDTIVEATPLASASASGTASFERKTDQDVWSFPVEAGHIYQWLVTAPTPPSISVVNDNGASIGSRTWDAIAFKASADGVWFALASAPLQIMSYSWTLQELGVDDHGDVPAQATAAGLSTNLNGTIDLTTDADVFSFSATAGRIYRAICQPSSGLGTCSLRMIDGSGQRLAAGSDYVGFEAPASGTYYVEVKGDPAQTTGSYLLQIDDAGLDDHGDSPAEATLLTPGSGSATGQLDFGGDLDVFGLLTTATHFYAFTCTGSNTALCKLRVRSADGTTVALRSAEMINQISFKATADQLYTIEVSNIFESWGSYTYEAIDLGPDDHGDTPATATPATVNASQNGRIELSSDVDLFKVPMTAGDIYRVDCSSTVSSICLLQIRDPLGAFKASTYAGTATSLSFRADLTGDYAVEVRADLSSSGGSYTLTLTDVGPDDHGDSVATASPISADGTTVPGAIHYAGDRDVFVFTGIARNIYQVTCTSSSYSVCEMVARGPDSAVLANIWNGTSTRIVFKAKLDGLQSIEVLGDYGVGSYSLTPSLIGTDDYGDTAAAATELTLGQTIAGSLEVANDEDWFFVTLTAGTTYTISTNSFYVELSLYRTDGTLTGAPSTSRTLTPAIDLRLNVKLSKMGSYPPYAYQLKLQ